MADTKSPHSKQVVWYLTGPPKLPSNVKDLLSHWSGLDQADDGIEKHVERVRDEAWKVHQYPCIGGYRFLTLGLAAHPSFDKVVADLKASSLQPCQGSPLYVDLGCCVGQDLRSLAYAGVPGSRLVGIDLDSAFIDIGYDLFRDREKLGALFVNVDILSPEALSSETLAPVAGHTTVLWASAFLHLWHLSGQVAVCHKILSLMYDGPGVRILGRHVGSTVPNEKVHVTNKSGLMYRHNPESFKKMWAEVLGHVGPIGPDEPLNSPSLGTWTVKAWFEEDKPADTHGKPDSDWLTKVAIESAGRAASTQSQDDRTLFLVWELERTK